LYLRLSRAWSKGVAVFFAVGAVSGTVLSFELGLLWPHFMEHAGPIIGLPFSWEGTAFFVEALAIGVFLYGYERIPERVHFASGIVVGVSGVVSGVLVVAANGWMNAPTGFRWVDHRALDVDPVAAMFNAAWPTQSLHMVLAAFASTAFAVAGLHAIRILRGASPALHRTALRIALTVGSGAALLQPISGDRCAKDVTRRQPAKLAAMEAHYRTQRRAPIVIGGLPDDETRTVRYAIEIPYVLSILAHADPEAEVIGLDRIPRDEWPPTRIVHSAFDVMVGCGTLLSGLGAAFFVLGRFRPAWLESRPFLLAVAAASPIGFVAVEAGWVVTETGRQPWIIYGILRTREALTPMPGLGWSLALTLLVYVMLTLVVFRVMLHVVHEVETAETEAEVPHG
jgi:cytochrome d ubiquinol oxidase subunit I